MDYPAPPAEKDLFSQLLGLWQPSAVRPLGYGLRCRVPSGFPGGSVVKNPSQGRSRGRQVRSLGWGMATHSSILTWRIPRTEKPVGYSPWGCKESDTAKATWHARRDPSPKAKSFLGYHIPGLSGDGKEGSLGPEGEL